VLTGNIPAERRLFGRVTHTVAGTHPRRFAHSIRWPCAASAQGRAWILSFTLITSLVWRHHHHSAKVAPYNHLLSSTRRVLHRQRWVLLRPSLVLRSADTPPSSCWHGPGWLGYIECATVFLSPESSYRGWMVPLYTSGGMLRQCGFADPLRFRNGTEEFLLCRKPCYPCNPCIETRTLSNGQRGLRNDMTLKMKHARKMQ